MDNETIRKGMSATEARVTSELVSEGNTIITLSDLEKKVETRTAARSIASSLAKKRWLERIGKGVYLVLGLDAGSKPEWTEDSYYIASKVAGEYYIGYYNMLNHYEWTEQIPMKIIVATTRPLKSRNILGVEYKFVTLSRKKFFGIEKKRIGMHEISVSDKEKTLVDALDHPEYCGGIEEVAKCLYNAKGEVEWDKILDYAKTMGNGAVFKRLGYLAEAMELRLSDEIMRKIRAGVTTGYSPLSPGGRREGKHDSRWNLILNADVSKQGVLA